MGFRSLNKKMEAAHAFRVFFCASEPPLYPKEVLFSWPNPVFPPVILPPPASSLDMCAAPGVSVTLFTQGCPHHCEGCHNPETWDFNGGKEFTPEVLRKIVAGLTKNGIKRSFCIMGGEPLCEQNTLLTLMTIMNFIKKFFHVLLQKKNPAFIYA